MVKSLGGLKPADGRAEELLGKVKLGGTVEVEWKQPRNLKMLRLYWALCQLVAENTEGYNPDNVSDLIKLGTGHYTPLRMPTKDGQSVIHYMPKSISFAAMDQTQFDKFFDSAINFVIQRLLPVSKSDLEREVYELVGIPMEG